MGAQFMPCLRASMRVRSSWGFHAPDDGRRDTGAAIDGYACDGMGGSDC